MGYLAHHHLYSSNLSGMWNLSRTLKCLPAQASTQVMASSVATPLERQLEYSPVFVSRTKIDPAA
jgi:hypothetical protein